MSDIKLSVSIALVAAVIIAEVLSAVWYSDAMPWGRYGSRFFLAGLVADVGLAVLLQNIIAMYWSVSTWEDAAMLSGWLTLLYACLEAPHCVHNHNSFSRFVFHAGHKFALMFAVAMALLVFKKY